MGRSFYYRKLPMEVRADQGSWALTDWAIVGYIENMTELPGSETKGTIPTQPNFEGVGCDREASTYWRSIFEALQDQTVNAIVVESLSGNGFTHSANHMTPDCKPVYLTAHSSSGQFAYDITKLEAGQVVLLDEAMDIRGLNGVDKDSDEQDVENVKAFCAAVKEKGIKVILHARPNQESQTFVERLRAEGLQIAEQPIEFGSRVGDMKDIVEKELRDANIPMNSRNLAENIAGVCVVPGEIKAVIKAHREIGLTDRESLEEAYALNKDQPHKLGRNPSRLGKDLFWFLADMAGNEESKVGSLNDEQKTMLKKAERFNLVEIQSRPEGSVVKVKTPDAYQYIIRYFELERP